MRSGEREAGPSVQTILARLFIVSECLIEAERCLNASVPVGGRRCFQLIARRAPEYTEKSRKEEIMRPRPFASRIRLLAVAAVAAAGCTVDAPAPSLAGQDVRLTIIHTADIH